MGPIAHIEERLIPLEVRGAAEPARVPLPDRMTHYRVPGVSVAVLHDGEIVWARGYGVRDAASGGLVTPETRFQAASISKPVAAVATLRLVARGVIALDADVNDYLTTWRVPPTGGWMPRITLRHLASHTAGTSVHGFPGYEQGIPLPTLPQILDGTPPANTAAVRVDTVPGVQFRYSGGGTSIIQQVLMDVHSGMFPEIARELVLEPAGMTDSTYAQPLPAPLREMAAHGHWADGTPIPGGWYVYPEQAAAGLWTTPTDLLRFARAMQRCAAATDGTLLSPAAARAMLTPQVPEEARAGERIGLGFFLGGQGQAARFGHGGDNAGFKAALVAYQHDGRGAAVMANGDMGDYLAGEVLWAIAEAYDWPGYREDAPPPALPSHLLFPTFAGVYALRPDFTLTVTYDGEALRVQPTGQEAFPVRRGVGYTFHAHFGNVANPAFTFVRDATGGVAELIFHQNDRELHAARVG